jgi:hypothetical protein
MINNVETLVYVANQACITLQSGSLKRTGFIIPIE